MNQSSEQNNENFKRDEFVDIINSNHTFSDEGKIIEIKGEKIIVENLTNHKELSIDKSEKRVLKQWNINRPIQKFNRVDFKLKDTDYWVEGVVMDIKPRRPYNKLLIKYNNNNVFKPHKEELVDADDERIAPIGLYTKDRNHKKLSSTFFNLQDSKLNNSLLNLSHSNLLNKKRNNPNKNNSLLNEAEDADEDDKFKILLIQNNLQLREVEGDGNCMFRAVSDQVYGTDKYYQLLREKCMDYLVILRKFFENYIDEDFDEYIKYKRKDKTWGDDVELEALSEIYNRPIEIYKDSNKPIKTFHEKIYEQDDKDNNNYSITPIRLSYHKKNHYNSIVPIRGDKINFQNYENSLIKTEPGVYETKILNIARENESQFDKGVELSKIYLERIKQNLAQTVEDLSKINNLNGNEKENPKNKKKKLEESAAKNKDNKEALNKSKIMINNEDKEKKSCISKVKDKEKEKDIEKKTTKENNENENIVPAEYLSNPTIKFAFDAGFLLEDILEAYSLFDGDKESIMNYLLNKKN